MKEIPQNMDLINLISSPKLETEDTRVPFSIRGHHLRFYHSLLNQYAPYGNISPEIMSLVHVRAWQYEQLQMKINSSQDTQSEKKANYFKDLIGETKKEHVIFRQKYKKTLEQFLQLPEDHPVELVQKPDAMCGNCTTGEHCKLFRNAYADKRYLTIFESENNHKIRKSVIAIEELVDFSDKDMQKVHAILTDAGTVKKTLLRTPYELWTPPDPPPSSNS